MMSATSFGIAKNARLLALSEPLCVQAAQRCEAHGVKQRLFADLSYAAASWDHARRVIAKAEHSDYGSNPRFVVSNLDGDAQTLYDTLYCARGDMENRIKEQQLFCFADRTSAQTMRANQVRLYFSSIAYTLLAALLANRLLVAPTWREHSATRSARSC